MPGPDIERLVLNMHTMGDITFATKIPDVDYANPDYPVEAFWVSSNGEPLPFSVSGRDLTGFTPNAPLPVDEQQRTREIAVHVFSGLLDRCVDYDHLYGIPQDTTLMAGMVALPRRDSVLGGRTPERGLNAARQIQGHHSHGETVAMLDNVLTTGDSARHEAEKLKSVGLRVTSLAVLIDREEGGRKNLQESCILVVSAVGMRQVVEILADNGRITTEQRGWIEEYYRRINSGPNR